MHVLEENRNMNCSIYDHYHQYFYKQNYAKIVKFDLKKNTDAFYKYINTQEYIKMVQKNLFLINNNG